MIIRPLDLSDLTQMRAIADTWTRFWGVPDNTTSSRIEEWLSGPTLEPECDTRSHWDDDNLIGFSLVSVPPSDARQTVGLFTGMVDPTRRGEGIGTDLVAWSVERARSRLHDTRSSFPMFIRAWAWEWFNDTRRLFEDHGLSAVRKFDVMEKDLRDVEPVRSPESIRIVGWDGSLSEEARLVNNTAFADHWGAVPISTANWDHIVSGEMTRLDLSHMAVDEEGSIAGYALSAVYPQPSPSSRSEAWVRILGVSPGWRNRGLGTALMAACHNSFLAEGITHSVLRVDAESPTGAHHLYGRLGYVTVHSSLTYEMEIEKDDSSLSAS